jgi:hypothetical protein
LRSKIASRLRSDEETKEERKLTGDAAREGEAEVSPGFKRRLVDELDISGL